MILNDKFRNLLIGKSRKTPSGWESVNCPACVHNGEPTPDDRRRGGISMSPDGSITFNCLRCHYRAHWHPGMSLNRKMQNLLNWFGMDKDAIKKLAFRIWIENQQVLQNTNSTKKTKNVDPIEFPETTLPPGSKPLSDWIEQGEQSQNFLDVCEYLVSGRGRTIAQSYEYFWTPHRKHWFHRSVIVPFYWQNKVVGYSARRIDKNHKVRYYAHTPKNFLFLNENIDKPGRRWIVVVEGVFDAIALDGVGALGGSLNDTQIQWLENSGREIIVVPDRALGGENLAEIAKARGWWVSIPLRRGYSNSNEDSPWSWDWWIKDPADAVKEYGRLFTLKSIFESITKDSVKIDLYMKMFFKGE